jgi:hypothetical protein
MRVNSLFYSQHLMLIGREGAYRLMKIIDQSAFGRRFTYAQGKTYEK